MNERKKWAKKEIELATKNLTNSTADKYTKKCYKSAFKLYKKLLKEELYNRKHSGMSFYFTKEVLNKLLDRECLTTINEFEFTSVSPVSYSDTYFKNHNLRGECQCFRYPNLFKREYKDGRIEYFHTDRASCFDFENEHKIYYGSIIGDDIVNKMFPITFPYTPEKYIVCFKENKPYYIIKPNGEKVEL